MKRYALAAMIIFVGSLGPHCLRSDDGPKTASTGDACRSTPDSVEAARREAKLLHETLHAMLHMIHARYFREDEGMPLPAVSFKMVFQEIERASGVKVEWLAVNLPAMHLDHEAKDEFEKAAVKSLAKGADFFEQVDGLRYRYAGPITMGSECLSCHSPTHSNNEPRLGGLVIGMDIRVE